MPYPHRTVYGGVDSTRADSGLPLRTRTHERVRVDVVVVVLDRSLGLCYRVGLGLVCELCGDWWVRAACAAAACM